MDLPLSKRVALITGASSGIGYGAAVALAAAGVKVAVTARRADRLAEMVAMIEKAGGTALALPGDVTNESFARGAVARTVEHFGRLDILVNAAGVIQGGGIENADMEQWHQVMELNLFAALYTCAAVIPIMREQGGGDIINISSTAARRSGTNIFSSYGASKVALNAMTESLRHEVSPQRIRVCVIEPGATSTEISESISDPAKRDFMRTHLGNDSAMKVEDIAAVILCAVSLPARANISEILIRPTADAAPL